MKNIIKRIFLFLLIFINLLVISGCGTDSTTDETVTVIDMVGDVVTIGKNPTKVACVSRTTYDLLIAFGLSGSIDGAYKGTLNNPWVAELYPDSKNSHVYGYQDSAETFISRGVDLVFAPEKYIADDLREHGVNAITVSLYGNPTFDNYVTYFTDLVTQIWDSSEIEEKVKAWNDSVNKAIEDITTELGKHEIEKKVVFYVRGDKDKGVDYTDTKGSFTEYAYRILGFDYVGSELNTTYPSAEEVISYNPDVFVCGGIYQNKNIERLHQEPYLNLDAVKNNKIYNIPIGFTAFEQLSAMTPIFLYDQANKIYPEFFNYDIATMTKETIRNYFGTELIDSKIINMLEGLDSEGNPLV